MVKKTNLLLLCLSAFLVYNCTNIDKAPESNSENIASVIRDLEKDGFSGSVLVAKEGEVQYSAGMGYANQEEKVSATPATLYDVGSITMGFTKVGIIIALSLST